MKNIIPAIASTNAVIAAACSAEALKLMSYASQSCNNFLMYLAAQGVYTHRFVYERRPDCAACGAPRAAYTVDMETTTLAQLRGLLCADEAILRDSSLRDPSVRQPGKTLFMASPPSLRKATEANLGRSLRELLGGTEEQVLFVSDPALMGTAVLELTVKHDPAAAPAGGGGGGGGEGGSS